MEINTINNELLPFKFKRVPSNFLTEKGSCYGMDHYDDNFAFALDKTISIYKNFKKFHEIQRKNVSRVNYYHKGEKLIALIDYFGTVIYETKTFTQVKEFMLDLDGNNWSCCFTDDEKYYICSGNTGRIIVIDLLKLEIVFQKHLHNRRVMGISVNGYDLLTSSYDGFIQRIDLHKMDVIDKFDFEDELSTVLNFGDYFYTSSSEYLMKCDRSGKILEKYSLFGSNAWCIQKFGVNYLIFISWDIDVLRIFDLLRENIIFEEKFPIGIRQIYLTNDRAFLCCESDSINLLPEFEYLIQLPSLKLKGEKISKLYNIHFFYH